MPSAAVASSPPQRARESRWWRLWPWLAAALPWLLLINYLRLEWAANEQYGYGFIVPFLALYLFLQRWPERPSPRPLADPGWLLLAVVPLAALAIPMLLLAEASPEWRLIGWFLALIAVGLTACLIFVRGGWPWLRHFAFSICFMLVAVPWPSSMELKIMLPLMQTDAASAVEILNWYGTPAVQHQNIIELPNGYVGVDEACSGIRSLQTSLMIALFVGAWLRLRILRRVTLVAAALAFTYAFNLLRTLILVSLSARYGNATMERWHGTIGSLVLILSLGGLWFLAHLLSPRQSSTPTPSRRLKAAPAPWPRPAMIALAAWFALIIIGTQLWFDWHGARQPSLAQWGVQWPTQVPTYESVEIPADARSSFMYSTEESSAARWQDVDSPSLWLGYFLRWKAGRETSILASNHHPDVCLPAAGKKLVTDFGMENYTVEGLDLPVQVYQFDDEGRPLFVFFCAWTDARPLTSHSTEKAASHGWLTTLRHVLLPYTPVDALKYRLQAIAQGRRNSGQQVLELGLWGGRDVVEARQLFQTELARLVVRPKIKPVPSR